MQFNIFNKNKQEKELIRNEHMFQTGATILAQPANQIDEEKLLERREMLIQLTQWQQDRSPQMRGLFLKLSGHFYDEKTKELKPYILKGKETGMCSLFGAFQLVNFIEYLDHNVMLANWSQSYIFTVMKEGISDPLRRFIFNKHNELGINYEDAELVLWTIINVIEPSYYRGLNNGERNTQKEIVKINEVRNVMEDKKKKGIFFGAGG